MVVLQQRIATSSVLCKIHLAIIFLLAHPFDYTINRLLSLLLLVKAHMQPRKSLSEYHFKKYIQRSQVCTIQCLCYARFSVVWLGSQRSFRLPAPRVDLMTPDSSDGSGDSLIFDSSDRVYSYACWLLKWDKRLVVFRQYFSFVLQSTQ